MTKYFTITIDVVEESRHAEQHHTRVMVPQPGSVWFLQPLGLDIQAPYNGMEYLASGFLL